MCELLRQHTDLNMEPKAEDYYDMPIDLLPSANFAGRPMSDIAMLDGLWTMIISSTSSSSDNEDDEEEGPTTPERNLPQAAEMPPTGPQKRPDITISSPSIEDQKSRLRSLSNDVKNMERPQLRKKANTAPSGTIPTMDIAMPQPRRATSARIGISDTGEEKDTQLSNRDNDSKTGRRAVKKKFGEAKYPPPQKPLPPVPGQKDTGSSPENRYISNSLGSFSQKLRVQRTLMQKQIGTLKTDIADYNSRGALNSAHSMLKTPRELYAIPEKQATHDAEPEPEVEHNARPDVDSMRSRKRRSARSISPATASPAAQSLVQARAYLRATNDIKVEDSSRPPRIYVPGAISLEEDPAMHRRDSVATLDPFDRPRHKAHRFSDMIVEEATIMFFDDLGVMEDATEASLDRYWLDSSRGYGADGYEQEAAWRRPSNSSVTETTPMSPQMTHSLHRSRFSSSSVSSNIPSPAMGKSARTGLGRLLSPALPGAALLRTPAIIEKQAKKWQARNEGG
ncbi:hypothetical protein T440DRAFT_468309 [Plenodomus tracheiphilus IPT5]|uniref:Uncharacterized protein n=1 Tax=Plenodomus tracheiphilus IPT5 TaxID=1408161 RepID=A0A6A7B917_9PLEO|nr:hypothetical protein T440DRAFT_468309 [Plenodomus tracheiphilus IPT5]